jgi:hypothetical protein
MLIARASWQPDPKLLGLAYCRFSWCHHLIVDFVAVHPHVVGRLHERIRGIGTGLFHGLVRIADDLGLGMKRRRRNGGRRWPYPMFVAGKVSRAWLFKVTRVLVAALERGTLARIQHYSILSPVASKTSQAGSVRFMLAENENPAGLQKHIWGGHWLRNEKTAFAEDAVPWPHHGGERWSRPA